MMDIPHATQTPRAPTIPPLPAPEPRGSRHPHCRPMSHLCSKGRDPYTPHDDHPADIYAVSPTG